MKWVLIAVLGLFAAWGAPHAAGVAEVAPAAAHAHADHDHAMGHGAHCHEEAQHAGCAASPAIVATHALAAELPPAVGAHERRGGAPLPPATPDAPYRPPARLA
jgi:hypothetical protein